MATIHDLSRWARLIDVGAKHVYLEWRHRLGFKPAPPPAPPESVATPATASARARIDAACAALGAAGDEDALRVIAHIAERAVLGCTQYGPLKLATDKRNWRQEAKEEAADGLFYMTCLALERER